MSINFYNVLEVNENASIDEIKKSYRQLSLIHHPDRNNNSSESVKKFQQLNEAYEILGNNEKKNQYDMSRNNPFHMFGNMMQQPTHATNVHMTNIEDLLSTLFRGGHNVGEEGMSNVRIFNGCFDEFNKSKGMNGIGINMYQGLQKPTPIIKTLLVCIDMIFSGGTMPIEIERWTITTDNLKLSENETIYIPIPKGIDDGEIIILKDKGNVMKNNIKGDVKIFIKLINNTELKRSGLDLIYEKTITLKEALCGFTFDIKFIGGKIYTINNKSGNIIPSNYVKTIQGMGITRDEHTGNLLISFNVKFPETLTIETLNLLKEINF